uniref:Ras-associating domain-containing protein n=1 Tax=Rhabditophanes sp. KR3021 TaxID=114890 RepID=A0AC35TRR2_9BILA
MDSPTLPPPPIQLSYNNGNGHETNTCNTSSLARSFITSVDQVKVRTKAPAVPPKPRIDSIRLSMANIKDSNDWELDALLNELSDLQTQLNSSTGTDQLLLGIPSLSTPTHKSNLKNGSTSSYSLASQVTHYGSNDEFRPSTTCTSPDIDSAYGENSVDCPSMARPDAPSDFSSNDSCRGSLNTPSPTQQVSSAIKSGAITPPASVVSSCSSSSGVSSSSSSTHPKQISVLPNITSTLNSNDEYSTKSTKSNLTPGEVKAQKIREALEKMKEANIKKVFVKFFLDDGHTVSILVDERWTANEVMKTIAAKLNITLHVEHTIVEEYPDLKFKRIYEDQESVVENILMWTTDSTNKLYFTRVSDKYLFMNYPQHFLVNEKTRESIPEPHVNWTAANRESFIKLFFDKDNTTPPELDGFLMLKQDGKKSWKKHYFVIRSSGLYYSVKEKSKASKDLTCIMNFYSNQVYQSTDWKKKYKAPTDFGFAIKPPQIQVKNSKYIKYICAEDEPTFRKWLIALRIAKNGYDLYNNYTLAMNRMVASQVHTPTRIETPSISSRISSPIHSLKPIQTSNTSSAASSLSINEGYSSNMSTSSNNSSSQHTMGKNFCFDQDDCGTIKRAPADISVIDGRQGYSNRSSVNMRPGLMCAEVSRNSYEANHQQRVVFAEDHRNSRPSLVGDNSENDTDTDEEPLPPPPVKATCFGGPDNFIQSYSQSQVGTFTPTMPLKSALKRPGPPPPPKRSDATKLQMTPTRVQMPMSNNQATTFNSELQSAMLRRLNVVDR